MSAPLRRLPMPMTTVFQDLFLLTYAVPPARLAALLPRHIHPYVRNGCSYVSVVVANIRGMRPRSVPEPLGTNYYQIVYRAVVRLVTPEGEQRPGVFFLRSDGNDPVMSFFGNRLTEFRFHYFHTGAITLLQRGDDFLISVESGDGGGDLVSHLRLEGPASGLPPAVGFANVPDELETLVQLFHAFAEDEERDLIFDLEIERGEWVPERLILSDSFSGFFAEGPFHAPEARPVSHLYIRECPYVWKPMIALPSGDYAPQAPAG